MKFNVDYEEEVFEYVFVSDPWDLEQLSFSGILGDRPLLKCWVEDNVIPNIWIRIPRIDVLRCLVLEVSHGQTIKLRFQSSSKSPDRSAQLSTAQDRECDDTDREDINQTVERRSVNILSAQEVIIIRNTDGAELTFEVDIDILLQTIRRSAEQGISPFEVTVVAEDVDNKQHELQLTRRVWMDCLLRGNPRCDDFLEYVTAGFNNLYSLSERLKELQGNHDLWLRLKCFHYDLKRFEQAKSRLEDCGGEFYMSCRYFCAEEVEYLLAFPTASGATARQALELMFAAKDSMQAVCTSHDMAPALERIYQIRKGFEREKSFLAYFKKFVAKKATF